jgi:di/tricarboxylate transporter
MPPEPGSVRRQCVVHALAAVSSTTITFLVLAAVVVLFIWDRLPVAIVAIGTALALWATGMLPLDQALAGFGDPTVVFIAALFVVSEALDATGVTSWAGQELIARVGALLVVMLWMNLISQLHFFGAELCKVITARAS